MARIEDLSIEQKQSLLDAKQGYASATTDADRTKYSAMADQLRNQYGLAQGGSRGDSTYSGTYTAQQLQDMINADLAKQTPVNPTVPASNPMQDAIDAYLAQQRAMADAAYQSNVAGIKGAESSAIAGQQALIPQTQADYEAQKKLIEQGVYAGQEQLKVSGRNKGIASSQQQAGLEAGVTRQGQIQVAGADQARVQRVQAINDRIAEIQRQAQIQIQQAEAQRQAGIAGAQGDIALKQLEQMYKEQDRTAEQQFAIEQQMRDYEQQEKMANLSYDQRVGLAELEQTYAKEMQSLDFANKMKMATFDRETQTLLMEADQKFRFAFLNAETAKQKEIIGLENAYKEKFFNMDTARQVKLMNMEQVNKMDILRYEERVQEKFWRMDATQQRNMLNLEQSNREKLLGLETEQQIELLNRNAQIDDAQFAKELVITDAYNRGLLDIYSTPEDIYADASKNGFDKYSEYLRPFLSQYTNAEVGKMSMEEYKGYFSEFISKEANKDKALKIFNDMFNFQDDMINSGYLK